MSNLVLQAGQTKSGIGSFHDLELHRVRENVVYIEFEPIIPDGPTLVGP